MPPFPSPTKAWHSAAYPSISPTRPEISAKGKTILITGGGTGIGAATALSFAEAGASRIALLGRRSQPLLDTAASITKSFPSVSVFTAPTDVTQQDSVAAAFADFLGTTGKINVLVSNAAILGPQDAIADVDPVEFIDAIQKNLQGSLHVAQTFLRYAAADAVVIEVNSAAAHLNFGPGLASYGTAKLAIFRLWDSVAFANPGLSVFHLQPGIVATAINKEAGGVEASGMEDHVSLPGNFSVWLASPEAKFLKGRFLWANWDVDELKAKAKEIESSAQLSIGLAGWPFQEKIDWKFKSVESAARTWN
ncbi:Short chain dehydrogenase citE [Lachnellula suecica]|uniref:Short chain dehydrogenase citE n=1 Tax=Lachnellula suecica TaxID=602035 RepID=A0A8T9C465_9HELO|nr:Short chain dehydrogenase citE [Lachnellula suecica]